jgi:hypothetical protein
MPTKSGHTTAILVSKVVGTPVFAAKGRKIGHIQDVMLDKLSDRLAFAILAAGDGAAGERRYLPLPWGVLDFDPGLQGYVIALSGDQLKNAPAFTLEDLTSDDGGLARELTNRFFNAI